jgi:predicted PurR-regulated permease PerM
MSEPSSPPHRPLFARRTEDGASLRIGSELPLWLRLGADWSWRLIIIGLGVLVFAWALSQLFLVTMPIVLAIVLATILIPPAEYLESKGLPPAAAGLTVVFGSLTILGGILAALAPSFISQLQDLAPTLADGRDAVLNWLETGPLGLDAAAVDDILVSLRDSFGNNSEGVVGGIVEGAALVGEAVTAFALMLVLLFFFVKDRDAITQWASQLLPAENRATAAALGRRAWAALGGYVRGTATIALIDAVGIGIGLLVLHIPLAMPLTFLVFLGGFLPVVGAFAAGLVAVLVALAAGGASKALAVLGVILVVQQLEGHILQPVIMRRAVSLHPTVILIALATGAAISGIIGAFLSVPIAAVAAAIGNELRLRNGDGDVHLEMGAVDPDPA